MNRRSVGFLVLSLALAPAVAGATRSPEEDRKAAYEQLEGKSIGVAAATQATGIGGNYGLKAAPAAPVPAMQQAAHQAAARIPGTRVPQAGARQETPFKQLADRGLSGILLSALVGLGVGGGFGLLTARRG